MGCSVSLGGRNGMLQWSVWLGSEVTFRPRSEKPPLPLESVFASVPFDISGTEFEVLRASSLRSA